ncbi:MAG: right-handed parallel beta-helix repeat-containing protein, partial [Planctomycetes bacterium]|nr:right-handed parallel beta-helix repeat-containing protein [Planctomycetota bacterium]
NYYKNNEVYYPLTDTWETKKETLLARRYSGVCAINDKIYSVCGTEWNGNGFSSDKIEEYDIQTDVWSFTTDANRGKRNFSYVWNNNELYLFGGNNITDYSSTVEKYNPLTETWSALTNINYGHVHSAAASLQGKIYVTGGYGFNPSQIYYKQTSVYTVQSDTWDYTKKPMLNARNGHVLLQLNGKLYAIGGRVVSTRTNTVEVFDPALDTWSYVDSMNEAKTDICGAVYNGKIYIFGGHLASDGYLDSVEEFTPKGDGTETKPYRTIQKGVDKAVDGDLVWVHDDVYKGDGNRDLDFDGKKIIVYGNPENPHVVTIDCEGSSTNPHRGFYFHNSETNDSILTGFTIQNGYTTGSWPNNAGAGIYCNNSNPTITNCILNNNTTTGNAPRGAGISLYLSSGMQITNCRLLSNTSGSDGGGISIMNSSSVTISDCYLAGNSFDGHGAIYIAGGSSNISILNSIVNNNTGTRQSCSGVYLSTGAKNINLQNCLIANNISNDRAGGFQIWGDSDATIKNCTISNNYASQNGGGIHIHNGAELTIMDSIMWGNTATNDGNEIYIDSSSGDVMITYCDVDTSTNDIVDSGNKINANMNPKGLNAGNGAPQHNISQNSRFVVGPNGVHYLEKNGIEGGTADSPCIDAGSANANTFNYLNGTTTCVDNREDTGTVDMGYHYPNDATCEIYVDDENGSDSTGDGSEQNPYKTIQKGIDEAGEGDIVWVEEGRYKGDGNRDLDMHGKAVRVKGVTGDPDDVIIDCEGSSTNPHRGFYFHSGETLASQIHSLTICHGFAPKFWDTYLSKYIKVGGGISCENSSPLIENCLIILNKVIDNASSGGTRGGGIFLYYSNSKILNSNICDNFIEYSGSTGWSQGAGVYCYNSNPLIVNCIVSNNKAKSLTSVSGGGIDLSFNSHSIIINCLIKNNTCETISSNSKGGGISISSNCNPIIKNCTISRNNVFGSGSDVVGGGICTWFASNPVFINSIIYDNNSSTNSGNEISVTHTPISNVYFDHCCMSDGSGDRVGTAYIDWNTTYSGNITDDSQFVNGPNGNYYLEHVGIGGGVTNSPCINNGTGLTSAYPYLADRTTAVDGSEDTGTVDMGYHYHDTAQSAYAIGWIGGGSNGWKTTKGTSPGTDFQSFNKTCGVFVDSAGNIYITEDFNNRISKWDNNGNAIGWIGGGSNGWKTGNAPATSGTDYQSFNFPQSAFVDSSGNIYIVDYRNHRICKWDSSGNAIGWIGGGSNGWKTGSAPIAGTDYQSFKYPLACYVASDGNLYVADSGNHRVSKWNANGNAIGWIGGGSSGWKTATGPLSYGSDYQSFRDNVGVCVDTSGNIFISEYGNSRVSKWDSAGNAIGWIGGG